VTAFGAQGDIHAGIVLLLWRRIADARYSLIDGPARPSPGFYGVSRALRDFVAVGLLRACYRTLPECPRLSCWGVRPVMFRGRVEFAEGHERGLVGGRYGLAVHWARRGFYRVCL